MAHNKPQMVLVYVTTQDKPQALAIGKVLVEKKLVACVNVFDGMESLYWWEGKIASSKEVVLVAKTAKEKVESLTQEIKTLHSYEVPCVVTFDITGGNEDYLHWITDSVSSS